VQRPHASVKFTDDFMPILFKFLAVKPRDYLFTNPFSHCGVFSIDLVISTMSRYIPKLTNQMHFRTKRTCDQPVIHNKIDSCSRIFWSGSLHFNISRNRNLLYEFARVFANLRPIIVSDCLKNCLNRLSLF